MTCQGQRHAGYSPHKHGVTGGAVAENKDWRGEPRPPADDRHELNARRSTHVQLCIQKRRQRVFCLIMFTSLPADAVIYSRHLDSFHSKNGPKSKFFKWKMRFQWTEVGFCCSPGCRFIHLCVKRSSVTFKKQRQSQLFAHMTAQKLKGHRFDPQQLLSP